MPCDKWAAQVDTFAFAQCMTDWALVTGSIRRLRTSSKGFNRRGELRDCCSCWLRAAHLEGVALARELPLNVATILMMTRIEAQCCTALPPSVRPRACGVR